MTKGVKLFIPKCEYFTTGGCVSPFNCPHKTEQKVKTGTRIPWNLLYPLETEKDKEIARLTEENERLRTENAELIKSDTSKEHCIIEEHNEVHYWRYRAKQAEEDVCLREKEIIELNASLSKMETVEKELKARLEKSVELPKIGDEIYIIKDDESTAVFDEELASALSQVLTSYPTTDDAYTLEQVKEFMFAAGYVLADDEEDEGVYLDDEFDVVFEKDGKSVSFHFEKRTHFDEEAVDDLRESVREIIRNINK